MTLLEQVREIIRLAHKEERADVTSRLLFAPGEKIRAAITAKASGVLCGVDFAAMAFKEYDPGCRIRIHRKDGDSVKRGQKVMTIQGKTVAILTAERKAVNFIQHLSGISTLTSKFVRAAAGSRAKIFDTRKTIPGIRLLQKYAVRCGGGENHRMNLSQMAMVKDNHIKALKGSETRIAGLKAKLPKGTLLEIEAKTAREIELALRSNADILMLDNMPLSRLKKAVRFIRSRSRCQIEVSGGVALKSVRKIARLGVERISVGALTHSAPALDLSMDVEKIPGA